MALHEDIGKHAASSFGAIERVVPRIVVNNVSELGEDCGWGKITARILFEQTYWWATRSRAQS